LAIVWLLRQGDGVGGSGFLELSVLLEVQGEGFRELRRVVDDLAQRSDRALKIAGSGVGAREQLPCRRAAWILGDDLGERLDCLLRLVVAQIHLPEVVLQVDVGAHHSGSGTFHMKDGVLHILGSRRCPRTSGGFDGTGVHVPKRAVCLDVVLVEGQSLSGELLAFDTVGRIPSKVERSNFRLDLGRSRIRGGGSLQRCQRGVELVVALKTPGLQELVVGLAWFCCAMAATGLSPSSMRTSAAQRGA
jgi:hypothetical protein